MPKLAKGKVYRTADLSRYGKNPTRLAARLVREGRLERLRKGLYAVPQHSVFGKVPPSEQALLKAVLHGCTYIRSGPSVWNALGLGSTSVEAVPLVYSTGRGGRRQVGSRVFEVHHLSRLPRQPQAEFFVVDLLNNMDRAGVDQATVQPALRQAVRSGRFDAARLVAMADRYGSQRAKKIVREAVQA